MKNLPKKEDIGTSTGVIWVFEALFHGDPFRLEFSDWDSFYPEKLAREFYEKTEGWMTNRTLTFRVRTTTDPILVEESRDWEKNADALVEAGEE